MELGIFLTLGLIIVVFVDIWLIINTFKSDKPHQTKLVWAAVLILLPVIGWIIWARIGPRGVARGPSSPEHPSG